MDAGERLRRRFEKIAAAERAVAANHGFHREHLWIGYLDAADADRDQTTRLTIYTPDPRIYRNREVSLGTWARGMAYSLRGGVVQDGAVQERTNGRSSVVYSAEARVNGRIWRTQLRHDLAGGGHVQPLHLTGSPIALANVLEQGALAGLLIDQGVKAIRDVVQDVVRGVALAEWIGSVEDLPAALTSEESPTGTEQANEHFQGGRCPHCAKPIDGLAALLCERDALLTGRVER